MNRSTKDYKCKICIHDETGRTEFLNSECYDCCEGSNYQMKIKNEVVEDAVREPQHYQHGIFEVIDEMIIVFGVEATMQFCRMNAWKYRARAPYKGKMEQDMDKANRYLEMAYEMSQIRQEYPEADSYEVVFLLKGRLSCSKEIGAVKEVKESDAYAQGCFDGYRNRMADESAFKASQKRKV